MADVLDPGAGGTEPTKEGTRTPGTATKAPGGTKADSDRTRVRDEGEETSTGSGAVPGAVSGADFTGAQHNHQNAEGGGQLTVAAIASGVFDPARLPTATTSAQGAVKQATAQADSTASDVATLKADFNALLAKLRTAGLMAP